MSEPLTFLIVDDSEEDRMVCRRYLRSCAESVRLLEAEVGREGLALAAEEQPDCVVLDYQLPDMDGIEFVEELVSRPSHPPVVVLTGRGDEATAVQTMKSGAADYLSKSSLTPTGLRRAVSNAIEKHGLRVALETHQRELQTTNDNLRRRNEEIRGFYHQVSHELKTPMTAAREFAAIVRDGITGDVNEEQQDCLASVVECCDQMKRLVDDMLDVTRIETGKLHLEPGPVDLEELARRAAQASHIRQPEGAPVPEVTIEAASTELCADETRVLQVLHNLLGNAYKFTDPAGRVAVRVFERPDEPEHLFVSVADSGRGIPPADLGRVFDRLYQVHDQPDERPAEESGLGLGLYICSELVRLHEGRIEVESEPGRGTTFTFSLHRNALARPEAPVGAP